ncbi:MAG: ketoacyl-ACP synthase III [Bacteroidetes bacterium]|nr:ketoacyl-ACP synthase III [Bacteroidota bacterium]
MGKMRAAITAVNGWVPEYILTNKELEKFVDTTDEWITSRTGINERRILKGEGRGSSEIAANAVNGLLKKRGIGPEEIEVVICATTTPDLQFPATANIVSDMVGMKNAFGFDLNAACSGFLYALVTGSKFIESGQYKKVVIIGVDKMSSIIDYSDRTTCVIFGDGGGAVLLEPDESGMGIIDSILHSDGAGRVHLHQKAGGSVLPASHDTVDAKQHFVYQEGQAVFKFAVTKMADVSAEIMERNQLKAEDVAWLVPHQANKRIIDATAKRMGLGSEKVMLNIQKFGNTTNGTIPLCLWEWENQLHKGDILILAAFGGGFTWGSVYIKWAYDSGK